MPLFYFDVHDGVSGIDRLGMDCPDREAARREVSRRAETLLNDESYWFSTGQDWQITVFDGDNAPLFSINFRGSADRSMTMLLYPYLWMAALLPTRARAPALTISACE